MTLYAPSSACFTPDRRWQSRLRWLTLLAAAVLFMGGLVQPAPPPSAKPSSPSPQSARYSPNVVVITLDGPIDAVTSVSIRRRIAEAELAGADAIVIQIDSPGGELGAVLEITAALKKTSVGRTVAWVNPQAYSGGAIIALACGEIVVAKGASFGDAAPIQIGMGGLRALPPTERAKILSPLLAEVVGSARRNGYDEKLVQGMVTLGVELWLVENAETGQRIFIDRAEYAALFDGPPPTSRPRLIGPPSEHQQPITPAPASKTPAAPQPGAPTPPTTDLQPASPQITPETSAEASMALTTPSSRPIFTGADKGKWRVIEYVADGTSLFTFSDRDMIDLRFAVAHAGTADELKQYIGATSVITLEPAWYESIARALRNQWLRGALVMLVIIGLAVEFLHPGLMLPATVAGLSLLGLLLPEILMGLAGWWEVALILGGVVLLAVELFVLPGLGIAGGIGLVSLLAGLVMAFIPSTPTFPGMERSNSSVGWGVGFVLMGIVTASVIGYYMSKNMRTLPVFGRLILSDKPREEDADEEAPAPAAATAGLQPLTASVGQVGVALTTLRPSGKADIEGRVVDVVVEGQMVQPGQQVRVITVEQMRIVVEPIA